ncbi:MAG: cytochrome c maturation protein CcmE [Acidimicrobiales bacterium]|jgi:cytochrome c-type biogenesis protein CcmE
MTTAPVVGSVPAGAVGPDGDGDGASPPPGAAPPAGSGHRLRYVIVGLVLVGSLAFLVVKGLTSALNFYLPADQALAQKASLGSQTFNLEGLVEPGSIHPTRNGVDFVVTSGATRLQVDNTGSPPQLFQPDIPVIAVGHFSGTMFVSNQILVKHSSNYIAAHPGRVTAPNGSKR